MTVERIISDLEAQLSHFSANHQQLELREKVLLLVEHLKKTRELNMQSVRVSGLDAKSGVDRLRLYLIRYVGLPIHTLELDVVSGISEYARRVRELRTEEGYRILSGPVSDQEGGIELRKNEYLLLRTEPDLDTKRRWELANTIRKRTGSAISRILAYLQANVGQIVTIEELGYVARDVAEVGRRIRDLRDQGYNVATYFSGRPDLKPGEYVMPAADRILPPHDRKISKAVERAVYARDNSTCVVCSWSYETAADEDSRFTELHHMEYFANRGPNTVENLVVLCNKCHDDVHAGRVKPRKRERS